MNPELVMPGYEPKFPQELLAPLGELDEEDTLVLVTVTVPKDIKKTTVNLRAPIIINAGTCKAVQLIADDENYSIKYAIYDSLMATQHAWQVRKKAGERYAGTIQKKGRGSDDQ